MPREVLLTGATGVLGSELVGALLADPETKLWLLLRAPSQPALDERLRAVIAYAEGSGATAIAGRVQAVRGDIRLPHLGLDAADYAKLARETTHIVHSAADVRFDRSIEEARSTAVGGLQNVVRLAREPGRTRERKKIEYVSTVGVAGARQGWIMEEPQPVSGQAFRNTYEQAKAESEELLMTEMARGVAATIHRPTAIVGNSKTGRIRAPQGFYFLVDFLLGLKGDRIVPDCDRTIMMDTIPVDYVTQAIDLSMRSAEFDGAILHLCSGPQALGLVAVAEYARDLLRRRGFEPPSVTPVALDRFAEHLAAQRAAGSRLHEALAQFEPYFGDHIEFDNRRATALLAPAGIHVPPVEQYLSTVLWAYWARRPPYDRAAGGTPR